MTRDPYSRSKGGKTGLFSVGAIVCAGVIYGLCLIDWSQPTAATSRRRTPGPAATSLASGHPLPKIEAAKLSKHQLTRAIVSSENEGLLETRTTEISNEESEKNHLDSDKVGTRPSVTHSLAVSPLPVIINLPPLPQTVRPATVDTTEPIRAQPIATTIVNEHLNPIIQISFPDSPASPHGAANLIDSSPEEINQPGAETLELDLQSPTTDVAERRPPTFVKPVENRNQKQEKSSDASSSELLDWWNYKMADRSRQGALPRVVSLDELIEAAVEMSPRIRSIKRVPQIASFKTEKARADFDPRIQWNTGYSDRVDPVGNTLTTGGAPFLEENTWDATGRVTRRTMMGSEWSIYQKLGFTNSNSNFFFPQDQGTATLGLDLRVPLANGRGREFNQSPIVIAELESQAAWSKYQTELQKEIADIGTLYWNLQNARALYFQQERSVHRAQKILQKLEARANYDTSISQIAQAKAELSLRVNELQASLQSIIELELTIRERIGDPELEQNGNIEIIPQQFPSEVFSQKEPELNQLMADAIDHRMELRAEQTKINVAQRQLYVSRCGLAPRLDMVFNVYASGLEGDTGIERAFQDQFGNTPGVAGSLEYELPYGRRNARASLNQAQLQRLQAIDLLQIQRNEIVADVHKAYSRWQSAKASYHTARQAVSDMRRSLEQLQRRWEEFAFVEGPLSQGATPSLALDQLLAGQRRLSETESRLATAELDVAISQQGLLSATGRLLHSEPSQPFEEKRYSPGDDRPAAERYLHQVPLELPAK